MRLSLILTGVMVLYASIGMSAGSALISEELKNMPNLGSLLDLRFGYTYIEVFNLLNALSVRALQSYITLLSVWDNLFPFVYGAMYMSWISVIYRNQFMEDRPAQYLNIYPLIPVTADLLENLFLSRIVSGFLEKGTLISSDVTIASLCTQVKWCLSTLNYGIMAYGIILLILHRNKPPKTLLDPQSDDPARLKI